MGVEFERQYDLIIGELMEAVQHVERFHTFFEMDDRYWNDLAQEEQIECLRTMSHDIIYGLGGEPVIQVGRGTIYYDSELAQIRVFDGQKCVHIVRLN